MKSGTIILVLILLLGFLIRIYPMLVGSSIGPDPNFHLRMTELWLEGQGKPFYDGLSMQGRFYSYPPLYHLIFSELHLLSSLDLSFLISFFPTIAGIIAIVLVYVFSRKIFNEKVAMFSAFALSVMNMHIIRTYSYARPDGLALLIVPAVIYLLYLKKFKSALLLSIALVLLHPLSTLFLLGFLIFWIATHKLRRESIETGKMVILIFVATAVFLLWLFSQQYPIEMYLSPVSFESGELTHLTFLGFFSFFTFSWLFIILGFFNMEKNLFLKSWFLYSLVFGFAGLRLGIFLSIPAAIIAGFGLNYALQKVRGYEKIFFALILILALFTIMPRLNSIDKVPIVEEKEAMVWIEQHSDKNASIAAQWDRGHPLTRYAKRKVIIDGYFEFAPSLEVRKASVNNLATTSDCNKIRTEVKIFEPDYFFVPAPAFSSLAYRNGILEATDCDAMDAVFHNDRSKVFHYTAG